MQIYKDEIQAIKKVCDETSFDELADGISNIWSNHAGHRLRLIKRIVELEYDENGFFVNELLYDILEGDALGEPVIEKILASEAGDYIIRKK